MAIQKYRFRTDRPQAGARLDHVLTQELPKLVGHDLSRAQVRKLVVAGAVYLNGKRVRIASKPLRADAWVEVWIDRDRLADLAEIRNEEWVLTAADVLYEDEHLIAVNKPAGVPTQPTLDRARNNVFAAVKAFLATCDGGQPYVALHHRLDRDTSGILLLSKSLQANPGVARLFAEHRIEKRYEALCERAGGKGEAGHAWEVKNHLKKEPIGRGKQSRMVPARSGGDFAYTRFRCAEVFLDAVRLEAWPQTGRMHQVRAHAAESGFPLLGDGLYGGRNEFARGKASVKRVMLHAANLTFPHPISNNEIRISCLPPQDFQKCLMQLATAGNEFHSSKDRS